MTGYKQLITFSLLSMAKTFIKTQQQSFFIKFVNSTQLLIGFVNMYKIIINPFSLFFPPLQVFFQINVEHVRDVVADRSMFYLCCYKKCFSLICLESIYLPSLHVGSNHRKVKDQHPSLTFPGNFYHYYQAATSEAINLLRMTRQQRVGWPQTFMELYLIQITWLIFFSMMEGPFHCYTLHQITQ